MSRLKSMILSFVSRFLDSILFGTLIGVIVFFFVIIFFIADGNEQALILGAVLLICVVSCIGGVCIFNMKKKFHQYDPELIGDNFIGFSRKCRDFKECINTLFSHMPNRALNGFKSMEENYGDAMSQSENAILCFYIARCYDLLGFYPNAHSYYKKSYDLGFRNSVLKFLTARCKGSLGDITEALTLYDEIISDKTSPFVHFVRTDIGKMYLNLNDGANALKWYAEAVKLHENYADALGGAAIANLLLHNYPEAEEYYHMAVLNQIRDTEKFKKYYNEVCSMEQKKTVSAEH